MDEIRSSLAENFSLTRGGPFYRLQVRLGQRETEHERVIQRALVATLITWLPMLILSFVQGLAFVSEVKVPFLRDIAVNVRFLIALPILILAESTIDRRWRIIAREFPRSRLLTKADLPAFESIIQKIYRLRDSVLPEVIILLLAYLPVFFAIRYELLAGISTWHLSGTGDISLADWWFNFVATPVFRFLYLRWVWRMLLWTLFLWRVSSLKLYVVATHSDGAAGLGFLSEGQKVFSSIVFAGGAVVAGQIGNAILYKGATLSTMQWHMVAYGVIAIIVLVLPLLVVTPLLFKTKKNALFEFGGFVTGHNQLFDAKWIQENHRPSEEVILGNPDASSLADLGTSFRVVQEMSVVPIDKNTLIRLLIAAALPMLPVVLFATPASEIVGAVLKALG